MAPESHPPLEEMTLRQLRKVASEYNISRYSRMRKAQLLIAIKQAMQLQTPQMVETEPKGKVESSIQEAQKVEASKFEVGQKETITRNETDINEQIGNLAGDNQRNRIVLLPRDPQWAYAYWTISQEAKDTLKAQGGQQLALRIYDVSDIDLNYQSPHSVQEYLCDDFTQEWYIPIPLSDRDYVVDIGYRSVDGRWLVLARSTNIHIPALYPSDWIEDIFATVNWEDEIEEKAIEPLLPPNPVQTRFAVSEQVAEAARVAGSAFAALQHSAGSLMGSVALPSGMGMWTVPTVSGLTMSGIGIASEALIQSRKFWLVADAELIVYGATEPDATVLIGGHPVKLNPDGTFRFQMSFQDGVIDYPIVAIAADGQQTRSIHMKFERETPSRNTNSKEEAMLEAFG
ncbi:hypothetical protein cce_3721 [Crocosphaera subtropica ATCC 51142]|uniref:Rho termination factor-like N-terminal domain-containing protein n=1 Tax=Crocosphaera subtropica (strain ATCC 51142 / BH68) TaxID=43989 RepID=B1X1N9_CROS5|nr:DUF4912 domain-containing protein [Crocosphaera subtropica]ACB53069.1 hypothetical protein cce_3721 [Crocosphaera subtropica ATCC 51142]